MLWSYSFGIPYCVIMGIGSNVNSIVKSPLSLHQAILDEDKEVIVELLDAGHSVENLNSAGWSPLLLAVVW